MSLRWGIASAGAISHDFCVALVTLPSSEHQIVAVGAQDLNRAKKFAEIHKIPKSYGSYKELAEDSDIDVVYIGVIHPLHYEVSMLMLDHGKHVLCEKPLCMNEEQVKKLTNYAKKKNLFLMEAVWSRFLPSYQHLKNQIQNDALGEIKEVDVTFGFDLMEVDRLTKKALGGGVILDLGIYTIQVSQWAFKQKPIDIKATGKLNEDGIDIEVEAELKYPNGGLAKIKLSAAQELENAAVIKGTKGQITLKSFWCSNSLKDVDGQQKVWKFPEPKLKLNFVNSTGLSYEAIETRNCILNKKLESEDMSHEDSIILAHIEDQMRRHIGVKYEQDNE